MSFSSLRDISSAAAAGGRVPTLPERVLIGAISATTSIKSFGGAKLRSRCFNSSFRAAHDWISRVSRLLAGTRSRHSAGMYISPEGVPTNFILSNSG
jgi:hypothetical protein